MISFDDPQTATYVLCPRCGNEVYGERELEENNGVCHICREELKALEDIYDLEENDFVEHDP